LEIAIALSIIGLISSLFITRANISKRIIKAKTTKDNIETVTIALAAYLAENSRLPRPSTTGDGLENAAGADLTNYVGAVPFLTLGIYEKYALDGDGHKLVYVVEPALTISFDRIHEAPDDYFKTTNYFCSEIRDPSIHVESMPNDHMDAVAFVLDDATNNPPTVTQDRIDVRISTNTCCLRRNFFLIKYLKSCPCNREKE
jgi:type II secretory pathway pseudopilin PulG